MARTPATPLTTAQVAAALDTTPRTLRKFLRSDTSPIEGVGKGSRYAITPAQVRSLKSRFSKWQDAVAAAKNAKVDEVAPVDEVEVEVTADGPTDEEIAAIDAE